LKRVEILQAYYAAAVEGHPESALEALNDPVFEESPYRLQALADAALRSRNYGIAVRLAMQAIERDPYSPLLANAYMVLGLSSAFRGDAKSALLHFQHALAASALPNIYGDPRNYVFTAYRFARAVPAAVGEIFDEVQCTRLSGVEKLKDPQDLIFGNKGFILLDKEAILTVSPEGKMLDTKPARNVEDIAVASNGKIYSITEERMDPGTGGLLKLSTIEGEKTKKIDNLRSMAVDIRGDVLFLDWDKGLLRGNTADAADSLSLTLVAKIKGRLIRTDSLGNLYILDSDRENILVFSREGVQLTSVSPLPVSGKDQSIEYFALDSLNHLYILTSGSLQIFAMINNNAGLDKKHITVYASEQNPRFRDLKVLGVSATGELVMAGKNDDNWVYFK
jgi:tetratricopeptide (TPR) repeat protein